MIMGQRVEDIRRLVDLGQTGSMKIFSGIESVDFGYSPTMEMMSLGQHLFHVSFVERHFLRKIADAAQMEVNIPEIQPSDSIKEELEIVKQTWELTNSLLARLDDNDLDKPIPLEEPGIEIDICRLLHILVEHLVHHRGEVIVYFRMMGRIPPRRYLDDVPE